MEVIDVVVVVVVVVVKLGRRRSVSVVWWGIATHLVTLPHSGFGSFLLRKRLSFLSLEIKQTPTYLE